METTTVRIENFDSYEDYKEACVDAGVTPVSSADYFEGNY
jgi:hypothetical protein